MKPDRLNALTDGVVAIAITIVVLELPVPETQSLAGIDIALWPASGPSRRCCSLIF